LVGLIKVNCDTQHASNEDVSDMLDI